MMHPAGLPIDDVLPELVQSLRGSSAAVLLAPPGAGKTTRVPPALLLGGDPGGRRVLVVQPRRVAARAAAARIAEEHGWRLGGVAGYRVRFDAQETAATRILVVTEGILLQRLLRDPFLEDTAAVVFDEFHERNLLSDLALGMVRVLQRSVRPELRILIMSATLNAEPIARYLDDCPIITATGRPHTVAIRYCGAASSRSIADRAARVAEEASAEVAGDVLVFLPGLGEIRRARLLLEPLATSRGLQLAELYGDLPAQLQDAVLRRSERRRIVLATNVAETSLTLEGVAAVVDCGWARQLRFDPRVGLDRLQLEPISQASADQRAGRAGRTGPGICWRLWDERSHRARPQATEPEIRRVDLSGALLQLMAWVEPEHERFPWFEPPRPAAIAAAAELLRRLGAADGGGISETGRRMARIPAHPRVARLLLEAERRNCLPDAALAAALLAERSPFARTATADPTARLSARTASADIVEQVRFLEQYSRSERQDSPWGRIEPGRAKFVFRVGEQLVRLAAGRKPAAAGVEQAGDRDAALRRALLAGFPDRLARRRSPGADRALMVGGRGVRIQRPGGDSGSAGAGELLLCLDVETGTPDDAVRLASEVDRSWLGGSQLTTRDEVFFDEGTERVAARRRTYWEDLLLEETPTAPRDAAQSAKALADAAARNWQRVFPQDDGPAAELVARLRCLRNWLPEAGLPELTEERLQSVLPALCATRRSFAELRSAPWRDAIRGLLPQDAWRLVVQEAPERIVVPSGRSLPLRYEAGRPPVLAVRIQEMFGCRETPRIARGRIRVLLHLLAPNGRAQQITDDLASFWEHVYPIVRKELRGRYPKHAWPEDPFDHQRKKR